MKSYLPAATAPDECSYWLRATTATSLVVFVHGILSSSRKCWSGPGGLSWPMLTQDSDPFRDASIFLGGYASGLFASHVGIEDAARALLDALETRLPGQTVPIADPARRPQPGGSPPLARPNLIFVCHSLGGIVVRKLLIDHPEKFTGKSVGLFLCASPSAGSGFASLVWPFAVLWKHRLAQQLRPGNEMLVELDHRFRARLRDCSRAELDGRELIETRSLLLRLPWLRIVSSDSATRYFPGQHVAARSHSSLVKPRSTTDPAHAALCAFARERGFDGRSACLAAFVELIDAIDGLQRHYATDFVGATFDSRLAVRDRVQDAAAALLRAADSSDRLISLPELPELSHAPDMDEPDMPFQGFPLSRLADIRTRAAAARAQFPP